MVRSEIFLTSLDQRVIRALSLYGEMESIQQLSSLLDWEYRSVMRRVKLLAARGILAIHRTRGGTRVKLTTGNDTILDAVRHV